MDAQTWPDERALFDEAAYLRLYPDIAQAIAAGQVPSAWDHYTHHGRAEGRLTREFDAAFYLRAYPLAAQEIAAGHAPDPLQHYLLLGRGRGYLPYRQAVRPNNAAALPSPFGGLWPDRVNAADIITGKLEIGQITERQAELLRFWRENGYVILPGAIAPATLDAACADLDAAYAGGFPDLRFECHTVARGHIPWQAEINPHPAKALDIHHFSAAIRRLMFAPAIAEFLGLIFESKAFASQTLGFLRGSAQEGHQDSAYVAYTIPRQFAATWVALEDVTLGAGELFYHPGSHRFPDFLYGGRFKSVAEAQRIGAPVDPLAEIPGHVQSLEARAQAAGLAKRPFAARKGDVLVWHADLVHGGNPVSADVTRKSIVTHYCPKHLAPLFTEGSECPLHGFNGHLYTTGYYQGLAPGADPR